MFCYDTADCVAVYCHDFNFPGVTSSLFEYDQEVLRWLQERSRDVITVKKQCVLKTSSKDFDAPKKILLASACS